MGEIVIVGSGPGSTDGMTTAVHRALLEAEVILGYRTYLDLIAQVAPQTRRESSGMRQEKRRALRALDLAKEGKKVCLVSGGDPGIYGMAGLVYEMAADGDYGDVPISVLPGVSALNAAAALLGAPLMNDFASVSLSDYLTPAEEILDRVSQAARAGFVLCLFNPCSSLRREVFESACRILNEILNPATPVGVVRSADRPGQRVEIVPLGALSVQEIGMDTILIVGNSKTRLLAGKMVTGRGYSIGEKKENDLDETG